MAAVTPNEINALTTPSSSGSGCSNSNGSTSSSSTEQRACDTLDCRVGKLISVVPKRKTAQFVTAPSLQEKPLLVNGLTSVFQVSGNPAKLSDIKMAGNPSNDEPNTLKPIFRVKPDSHVHIINYIVVDDDSDVVRKISENDSDTMRILLESQRVSAEAKLQKLMANHAPVDINALVTKKSAHLGGGTSITALPSTFEMAAMANTTPVQQTQPTTTQTPTISTQTPLTQPLPIQQLPAQPAAPPPAQVPGVNFGLSIASVAEGVPFISAVPLNTLQAPAVPEPAIPKPVESTTVISKMQEELDQLRRTVAQLAAQAQTK